jgi:hypothetical protein
MAAAGQIRLAVVMAWRQRTAEGWGRCVQGQAPSVCGAWPRRAAKSLSTGQRMVLRPHSGSMIATCHAARTAATASGWHMLKAPGSAPPNQVFSRSPSIVTQIRVSWPPCRPPAGPTTDAQGAEGIGGGVALDGRALDPRVPVVAGLGVLAGLGRGGEVPGPVAGGQDRDQFRGLLIGTTAGGVVRLGPDRAFQPARGQLAKIGEGAGTEPAGRVLGTHLIHFAALLRSRAYGVRRGSRCQRPCRQAGRRPGWSR